MKLGGNLKDTPNVVSVRKPYAPPSLTTVNLRPEEAVLGHCKISTATGPSTNLPCTVLFCSSIGS
jgi:hypothetical protein